jgi:hypothetical protein
MAIGDHLRDVMDLYGSPKCPHTNAVLITAGEKGVDINSHVEDDWGPSSSIQPLGPGTVPYRYANSVDRCSTSNDHDKGHGFSNDRLYCLYQSHR